MDTLRKHKHVLITAAVFAVSVVAATLAYNAALHDLDTTTAKDFEKNQKIFVSSITNTVEQYFDDIQKRMETIALTPGVREAQRSESCNKNLQDILEVNKQEFNNLGRINKDGIFVCAVNRTIIGEPASKYGDYFATVAQDPEHKPVMSRLILPTGGSSPVIAVHVPVYDTNGQFNGTIGGAVYFDDLEERILPQLKLTPNSVLAVYDNNLDILYHPDPLIKGKSMATPSIRQLYTPASVIDSWVTKVQNGPSEGIINYSLKNAPRQTAYKSAAVVGRYWTIGIAVPQKDITDSTQRTIAKAILATTLGLLAIAAATITFTRLQPRKHKKAMRP